MVNLFNESRDRRLHGVDGILDGLDELRFTVSRINTKRSCGLGVFLVLMHIDNDEQRETRRREEREVCQHPLFVFIVSLFCVFTFSFVGLAGRVSLVLIVSVVQESFPRCQ
jgi:hypothetical protein